ncbi:MAG: ComF family protein [Bacteroidales bacterium]
MNIAASLADDLFSLLFPRLCHACGDHLVRNENVICTGCRVAIPKTGFEAVRDNFVEKLFWGRCRLEKATALAFYIKGGKMSRLVYRLKYDGYREIGAEMGRMLAVSLMSAGFLDDIDCLVPVPLHPARERKRGFNQSLIIAEGLSSLSGIEIVSGSLVRICGADTQTVRSRTERWRNVEGIFAVKNEDELLHRHVLLVDDVITTGSTIDACYAALSGIQGIRVSAASLAVAMAIV